MKTDKFDDAIRRKLESIEPPFRERDWSHMQAFMHGHGYPPAWAGASQWLMPMAVAAAVTGLIVSTIWQFHTNQQLRQSVQTLSQTIGQLETTQATLIKQHTRTDTVYVTNFTQTPASAAIHQLPAPGQQPPQNQLSSTGATDRYAHQSVRAATGQNRPGTAPDSPLTVLPDNQLKPNIPAATNRLAQRIAPTQGDAMPAAPTTPTERPLVGKPAESANTAESDRTVLQTNKAPNQYNQPSPAERLREQNRSAAGTGASRPVANQPETDRTPKAAQAYALTKPSGGSATRREVGSESFAPADQAAIRQAGTINLLSSRPLVIDSAYYLESIARRTRRIRSLLPATVTVLPTTTAPAEVAGSRPASNLLRVRLGVTGEVSTAQRTVGIYSEVLVGRHWSVGFGLNQLHVQGGQFGNEDQFRQMTHDDFRKIYAPRIDPFLDIININQQFALWQIPVNVGYRAALGKGFALMPSVGMDFSVSATETTTFTYRRGPLERNATGLPPARECASFNSYTVYLGAEKSWKHLVFQAGPLLSLPTKTLPDPLNPASLGLRTRVLFQF